MLGLLEREEELVYLAELGQHVVGVPIEEEGVTMATSERHFVCMCQREMLNGVGRASREQDALVQHRSTEVTIEAVWSSLIIRLAVR